MKKRITFVTAACISVLIGMAPVASAASSIYMTR